MAHYGDEVKKLLACHVVIPAGIGTRSLDKTFRELSVRTVAPDQIAPAGETIPVRLRASMRSVDFVLAVFNGESESVLFELGVAAGLHKATFLVLLGEFDIPFSLRSFPSVRLDSLDDDALTFHLRLFVRNLGKRSVSPNALAHKTANRQASSFWGLTPPDGLVSESQLEMEVRLGLEAAGVVASAQPRFTANDGGALRPDLVAWFDGMPESLGNPIIIEVKQNLSAAKNVLSQMSRYMRAANTRSSLIIAGTGEYGISAKIVDAGCVFILSASTLFDELAKGSLFDALVKERNLASHEASN